MQKIGEITKTADKQGEFTNGSVAEGIEPTELDCQWFNTVQRELIAVLAAAGIKTIPENDAQLVEAIKTLLKKGDDEVRKAVYPKEEADKRFLPATTRIPDAWTKTEASKRFQPRGDYQPAGYAYSKKESDKRYLPVSTKIPDAYSKKESDKKYQLKGEGVGYSKEDIDNKFSELGTAAQKDVNRDPKKPDKGAVLCVGDLGIGDPIFIPAKGRLADFLASAQGLFYVTAGDAFFFSDKPEWFDDHEVIYVFVQGSGHTYGPEAKYIRLWNHLGQEAFCIFKRVSGGGSHHPEFSGWKRVFNGDNYYTKKEMEETFLKMPNHANHTSAGSVGMFLYRGEVALSAGSSVSGATLDPACIVFKQTINPHVYSGGDPRGMPGTWRALGMIDRNSVCLFARVA